MLTPMRRQPGRVPETNFSEFMRDEGSARDVMLKKRVLKHERHVKEVIGRMKKAEAGVHILKLRMFSYIMNGTPYEGNLWYRSTKFMCC